MKVINIFGGPGIGKSTTAASLFAQMKYAHINCELVFEQAKNFTWEKRDVTLACQPYIFAKQMRDIWRLKDQVDYAIVDSPLMLSWVYGNRDMWPRSFFSYALDQFCEFHNINFVLERSKEYSPIGRNQTEEEAREIDNKILQVLKNHHIPFTSISTKNYNSGFRIFSQIFS